MNLNDQAFGHECAMGELMQSLMDMDQAAMHEIQLDRQHRAEDVANRIRCGMATVEDAKWIESEYGLTTNRKGLK